MKIFIIHYKKLKERKEHIIKELNKYNITDFEFIDIDRDELDTFDLSLFHDIPNPHKAITLSHIFAFKQIRDKYHQALILEDDIILCDNFFNILNIYLKQLPPSFDMCFFSSCHNLNIPSQHLIPNKFIYHKSLDGGSTRTLACYLVSKNCAIKLCHYIDNIKYKINLPTDHWLNIVAKDINLNMFWAEPTIAIQGSETGLFQISYKYM